MLNKIKLVNFGCHEQLAIDLHPGLNAVKAGVERGKSTIFKAIAYALFGSKALPDSLDDAAARSRDFKGWLQHRERFEGNREWA